MNRKNLLAMSILPFFVFSNNAFSSGLPTIDVAAIAQMARDAAARAKEAKSMLDQAKRDFELAKQFGEAAKNRFEGYSDYSYLFDRTMRMINRNLRDLTAIDNALRNEYGLSSDNELVQRQYDTMLKPLSVTKRLNQELIENSNAIDQMALDLANATTPQMKQDMQTQINLERMRQANLFQQYELAKTQAAAERKIEQKKIANEYMRSIMYGDEN